jgi:hypothetical protein
VTGSFPRPPRGRAARPYSGPAGVRFPLDMGSIDHFPIGCPIQRSQAAARALNAPA